MGADVGKFGIVIKAGNGIKNGYFTFQKDILLRDISLYSMYLSLHSIHLSLHSIHLLVRCLLTLL